MHLLLQDCLRPLRLKPTARDTLREFIDIDVTADDLVRILNRNLAYRDMFERFVQKKIKPPSGGEKKDGEVKEPSPTHRLVSLLGMIGSRNFILALRMGRLHTGKFPVQEDGGVDLKAGDFLKRATEIEEQWQRNGFEYGETAFAGGVLHDMILNLARQKKDSKKLEESLQFNWKQGLRMTAAAHQLAIRVGGFAFLKFAAAGALSVWAGRSLMEFAFPGDQEARSWAEFQTKFGPWEEINPTAFRVLELDVMGVQHEEVAAWALEYFDVFQEFAPAVRWYREPYQLKNSGDRNLWHFASLLNLASKMGRAWRLPQDEKDATIQAWAKEHPELKLRPKSIHEAYRAAMTMK